MARMHREREESEMMVNQAEQLILQMDKQHLKDFIHNHPNATYEEWIATLHPDNVTTTSGDADITGHTNSASNSNPSINSIPKIDHRFYIESSDHRIMWNEYLVQQQQKNWNNDENYNPYYVPARSISEEKMTTAKE